MRLLIADDNEFLRTFLRVLLQDRHDWQICGEAANGREAITKVRELSPDVIILDLSMPVMNGFEAAKQIRRIAPTTKIVFFSAYEVPATATEVVADAFVEKSTAGQELIPTIEHVISEPRRKRTHTIPSPI